VSIIDLRSDTVTRPTAAMRAAMAQAPLGDDVYGEDPSVNALQDAAAKLLGKEAALFMPSGTMANQAAMASLASSGDVILVGEGAHVDVYETGSPWALFGLGVRSIGSGGFFDAEDVRRGVTPADGHFPITRILAFENTHNRGGGKVLPLEQLRAAASAGRELGLSLHLDGARLFNAVVATGVPAADWAEPFDTISFCLSKGLGAPVGSIVCASRAQIARVHRLRKRLGGGMRQAGVIAAAGLHALEHHVERLADDHANARRLAEGLRSQGYSVEAPETNMVFFHVDGSDAFQRATQARNLLINPVAPGRFRAVTHLDVTEEDIDEVLARIANAGVR
jgi:threonine aldolase